MAYIGIDPGKNGAMAEIIDGREIVITPFDEERYIDRLKQYDEKYGIYACVERVGAMPGQGVTSMFNFGRNFGWIMGVLGAFGIPYELVTPQRWKREFGITKDKNKSIEVCQRLFPNVSLLRSEKCRTPHDGMAEALLMAEYARRKM